VMANWLSIHLEDICALPATDDVSYFHDELTDIFRTNAKWPREEQPQRADVGCSDDDCDGRLIIYPPRDFEDERRIICEGCGTHLEPAEYEHQILVQNEMKAKRAQESATAQAH